MLDACAWRFALQERFKDKATGRPERTNDAQLPNRHVGGILPKARFKDQEAEHVAVKGLGTVLQSC